MCNLQNHLPFKIMALISNTFFHSLRKYCIICKEGIIVIKWNIISQNRFSSYAGNSCSHVSNGCFRHNILWRHHILALLKLCVFFLILPFTVHFLMVPSFFHSLYTSWCHALHYSWAFQSSVYAAWYNKLAHFIRLCWCSLLFVSLLSDICYPTPHLFRRLDLKKEMKIKVWN